MKKFFLALIFSITLMTGLCAQDYKWWVGGHTNLWFADSNTAFNIAPEVGYLLSPKFTLAASLGYYSRRFDSNCCNNRDLTAFVVNPYVRYITFKKGNVLGFVDGGIEFGLEDMKGVQVGLKPGIAILLNDRFTAATQFGFLGYSDGKNNTFRSKGFGLDLSGYCSTIAFFYSF